MRFSLLFIGGVAIVSAQTIVQSQTEVVDGTTITQNGDAPAQTIVVGSLTLVQSQNGGTIIGGGSGNGDAHTEVHDGLTTVVQSKDGMSQTQIFGNGDGGVTQTQSSDGNGQSQGGGQTDQQQCISNCGLEGAKATTCTVGSSDYNSCICQSSTYQPAVEACIDQTCPSDQTTGLSQSQLKQTCDSLGGTITQSQNNTISQNQGTGAAAHGVSMSKLAAAAMMLLGLVAA